MWIFIAGIVLVCLSAYLWLRGRMLLKNGFPVSATVTRVIEEYEYQQGGTSFYPVLRYEVDGVDFERKHPFPNFFSHYHEGQILTVYCSRKNPKIYAIQGDKGVSYVLLLGMATVVLGAIGIAMGS